MRIPRQTANERGMTFSGLIAVLVLAAFFALPAIKVIPLYAEWGTVSGALDTLARDFGNKGRPAMMEKLRAQFSVDNVETISARDIVFKPSKDGRRWMVTADYEARTSVFENIGVFIQFHKTVEVER